MKTKNPHSLFESKIFVPLLLFFACLLTFGLLIPLLGFYWDDWLVIFHIQNERMADLITLYAYDRPLSVWTALLSAPVLGTSPIAWQLFSILLRALSAYLLFLILKMLLPGSKKMLLWIALLFALYPAYTNQAISVAFSQHWIAYSFFLLSIFLMGQAQLRPKRAFLFTVLSLFSAMLHLVTLEYFAGLELLRLTYLYALNPHSLKKVSPRILAAVKSAWPYLVLLFLWAIWRLFFIEFPVEPHPPVLLTQLRAQPVSALIEFAGTAYQSVIAVLFSSWQQALSSLGQILQQGTLILGLFFSLGLAASLYCLIKKWQPAYIESSSPAALPLLALIGLLAIFLGLLPIWLVGESPIQSGYNERFAIPALFGAAMFLVALLHLLLGNGRRTSVALSALLAIAVFAQINAANVFRKDWLRQAEYFTQLAWRAPAIAPNTALIFFSPLTEFMPTSSSSVALNSLYEQSRAEQYVDYWYFDLELSRHVRNIEAGQPLNSNYRGMLFDAESADALLYFYQPKEACLWLLSPIDQENPYLPEEIRHFANFSNPARIDPSLDAGNYASEPIFDLVPRQTWCYAYQQTTRLEQIADWLAIEAQMQAAIDSGLGPQNALEWLPLLAAHINLGAWQAAEELSLQINHEDARNAPMLCLSWNKWQEVWGQSAGGQNAWQSVNEAVSCAVE